MFLFFPSYFLHSIFQLCFVVYKNGGEGLTPVSEPRPTCGWAPAAPPEAVSGQEHRDLHARAHWGVGEALPSTATGTFLPFSSSFGHLHSTVLTLSSQTGCRALHGASQAHGRWLR